ncbi:MAG: hypothetical protein V1746_00860 [bacterium]
MKYIGAAGLVAWIVLSLPAYVVGQVVREVAGENAQPARDADPEKNVSQYLIYLTWYIHGKVKEKGGFGLAQTLEWCKEIKEQTGQHPASSQAMRQAVRDTSQDMRLLGSLSYHQSLHQQEGGSFSKKQLLETGTLSALSKAELASLPSGLDARSFSVAGGKVVIDPKQTNFDLFPKEKDAASMALQSLAALHVDLVPPVFLPDPASSTVPASASKRRGGALVLKISYEEESPFAYRKELRDLEKNVNGMAGNFLFGDSLKDFNPQAVVASLVRRAGVNMLGGGIVSRPAAAQDTAFIKYIGLRENRTHELLFWSDPMVGNGYDPLFGSVLNNTALRGYRPVDMDNVLSRGYSRAIDEWNISQPAADRIPNPFKGYAAKVMPGLLKMQEEGRLEPNKNPSKEQMEEAMKLTPKLRMLPSENIARPKVASLQYSGRGGSFSSFSLVRVGGTQSAVPLEPLALAVHEKAMTLAAARLKQIDEFKTENRYAYSYVNGLINSYFGIEAAAKSVVDAMAEKIKLNPIPPKGVDPVQTYVASIPEVALLRQQVWAAIENLQRQLSELDHQYDQLKQNEWGVLERVLQVKKKSIKSLMENASMRYNAALVREKYK